MNAEEFAIEFVNDLLEDLQNPGFDLSKKFFVFYDNVYVDDPNLQILKSKLNEINFDIVLDNVKDNDKFWKVFKI